MSPPEEDAEADAGAPRQRVERVPGSRRARLTAVPGTDAEPEARSDASDDDAAPEAGSTAPAGPNDARLRADVPPHY